MFPFDRPETIGKTNILWRFQGDQEGVLGRKVLMFLHLHVSITPAKKNILLIRN